MILGKISGAIHSTINHKFYDNRKLLVVDKLDLDGKPTGDYLIAVDQVGAGAGETVLLMRATLPEALLKMTWLLCGQ
ncbi:MAG: hypothetical protein GWP19_15455 [Planctomycetia bacterium]|nr:hypothetical protein [Planctomycetia bacterium]